MIFEALSLTWVKLSSHLRIAFDLVWSEDMGVIRISCLLILKIYGCFSFIPIITYFLSALSNVLLFDWVNHSEEYIHNTFNYIYLQYIHTSNFIANILYKNYNFFTIYYSMSELSLITQNIGKKINRIKLKFLFLFGKT